MEIIKTWENLGKHDEIRLTQYLLKKNLRKRGKLWEKHENLDIIRKTPEKNSLVMWFAAQIKSILLLG